MKGFIIALFLSVSIAAQVSQRQIANWLNYLDQRESKIKKSEKLDIAEWIMRLKAAEKYKKTSATGGQIQNKTIKLHQRRIQALKKTQKTYETELHQKQQDLRQWEYKNDEKTLKVRRALENLKDKLRDLQDKNEKLEHRIHRTKKYLKWGKLKAQTDLQQKIDSHTIELLLLLLRQPGTKQKQKIIKILQTLPKDFFHLKHQMGVRHLFLSKNLQQHELHTAQLMWQKKVRLDLLAQWWHKLPDKKLSWALKIGNFSWVAQQKSQNLDIDSIQSLLDHNIAIAVPQLFALAKSSDVIIAIRAQELLQKTFIDSKKLQQLWPVVGDFYISSVYKNLTLLKRLKLRQIPFSDSIQNLPGFLLNTRGLHVFLQNKINHQQKITWPLNYCLVKVLAQQKLFVSIKNNLVFISSDSKKISPLLPSLEEEYLLYKKMQQKINLKIDNLSLPEIVSKLNKTLGMQKIVLWPKINRTKKLSLHLQNLSLQQALNIVLHKYECKASFTYSFVVIAEQKQCFMPPPLLFNFPPKNIWNIFKNPKDSKLYLEQKLSSLYRELYQKQITYNQPATNLKKAWQTLLSNDSPGNIAFSWPKTDLLSKIALPAIKLQGTRKNIWDLVAAFSGTTYQSKLIWQNKGPMFVIKVKTTKVKQSK